ncbi:MAG TPA: LuxR C-terminal-related transcriptional regulator [Xanthobacteraceae bacterium]|nr:LuxR C-terminal-related transcriptional regulator [Xanthobacteraceae bacterium]
MDVTGDYTAQNLSVRQRDVMKLIVRGLSNKEIASILNLAEGSRRRQADVHAIEGRYAAAAPPSVNMNSRRRARSSASACGASACS